MIEFSNWIEVEPRPAMPATVSWNQAARFINWLNEDRGFPHAYKFAVQPGEIGYDANANIQVWAPGDSGYDAANPFRNTRARYHLPSFAERFKAAYHDPLLHGGMGGYWNYANGSDVAPVPVAGGTEHGAAVVAQTPAQGPADATNAGGLSPWGVMAMEGNVWEWEETTIDLQNDDGAAGRAVSGGQWFGIFNDSIGLSAIGSRSCCSGRPPEATGAYGFRIASTVDQPSVLRIGAITPVVDDVRLEWNSLGDGWS